MPCVSDRTDPEIDVRSIVIGRFFARSDARAAMGANAVLVLSAIAPTVLDASLNIDTTAFVAGTLLAAAVNALNEDGAGADLCPAPDPDDDAPLDVTVL